MKIYIIVFLLLTLTGGIACKKKICADQLQDNSTNRKKVIVTTVAGEGTPAFVDGRALFAKFNLPEDVAITADGSIYVADLFNSRVRKITGGQISTFAGNGTQSIINGNGKSALYIYPMRLALDASGYLYTLDGEDTRIRKISPAADVSTYAGIATPGFVDGKRDAARFEKGSGGIVADVQGNIYVSDTYNNRIRKITVSGEVVTIAGNGIAGFNDGNGRVAQFHYPGGIVIDQQGNLYVSDRGNYRIRKITPGGQVSTVAGNGMQGDVDGTAGLARFNTPLDLVIDTGGNVYVTDNHRIRKISAQGMVSTLAGSIAGYNDGEGKLAKFHYPTGMGIDVQGNIYVADSYNNRIRKISFQ